MKMPVVADPFLGIVFDTDILVLLGMDEYLFAALFVFEPEFIEPAATLAAVGFDGGHRGIVRKGVRGLGFAIINCAGDNRPVRISVEELDDDFLSNAWDKNR